MENSEALSNASEDKDLLRGDINGAITSQFEAVLAAAPQSEAIVEVGNDDDEVIVGTADNDTLRGEGGRDQLSGRAGDDLLDGGKGADTLLGEAGDDRLFGRAGADQLRGGQGDDVLNGAGGADDLAGGAGADRLVGGGGRDTMSGGGGADTMLGGGGADEMSGNGGGDQMQGGNGADSMFGNGGRDQINGDNGADEIDGGGGADTLNGDRGRDQIDGGRGRDLISGGDGDDTLNGDNGADTVSGDDGDDIISGGAGDDSLSGDDGDDVLSGGDGDDVLNGGDGDDTLVGNKDDDQVFGGDGDDLLVWNNGDGSDLLNGGDGDDIAQVNFDTDLVNDDLQNDDVARISANGENVLFERTAVNGQSEAGLFSLDIQETETLEVNFGGGDDTAVLEDVSATGIAVELDGGEGIDTLDLSALNANVTLDLEAGTVTLNGTEEVLATFENFENVIGSDANEVLIGDAAANVLDGQGDEDDISGGDGDDTLIGGDGDDTLVGNKGDDQMFGGDGDDLLVWNNGDGSDLLNGGDGDDIAQVNFDTDLVNDDLQNDDVARISANGENVLFERTAVNGQSEFGLFSLDIQETETLEVNFGGGDDTAVLEDVRATGIAVELDGGDGVDTLDLSAFGDDVTVDFEAGTVIDTATEEVLSTFENFENVIAGDGDDTVVLEDIDRGDVIIVPTLNVEETTVPAETSENEGGGVVVLPPFEIAPAIVQELDGGDGTDTLDLSALALGVIVDFEAGTVTDELTRDVVATFENFENVVGGAGNDVLTGDDQDNDLNAGAGANTLAGLAGDDTLSIDSDAEVDQIDGGEGFDTFDVDFSADPSNEDQASLNIAQFTLDGQNVLLAQSEFNEEFNFALTDPRFLFNLVQPPAKKPIQKIVESVKMPIIDGAVPKGGPAALEFEFQEFAAQNVEALSVDFGDGNAAVILTDDFAFRFDIDGGGDDNGDVADITTGDTLVTSGLGDPRGKFGVDGVVVDLDKDDDGGEDGTVEIGFSAQPALVAMTVEDSGETVPEPFNITDFENVIGTIGADSIEGNAEANVLSGLFGNDILSGDDGNDLLQGGQGADTLIGGAGDDTLSGGDQEFIGRARPPKGGTENDVLTGGEGADTFVFKDEGPGAGSGPGIKKAIAVAPFFGNDIVTDFTAQGPSADVIDLSEFVFAVNTFEDLVSDEIIFQDEEGVTINVANGSSIFLQGADIDDLSAANFLFADEVNDPMIFDWIV